MNNKIINIGLAISFVLFLILALVFNNKANNAIENSKKSLNIFSNNSQVDDAYIYIDEVSEDNNGYAIVFDDTEPLVVYLNDDLSIKIKDYSFDSRTIKLVGDSKKITTDVMNKILAIYNKESNVGDEDYLSSDSFTEVFGTYYLDVDRIEDDNELHKTSAFFSGLFLDISLVSLLILCLKLMLGRRNQ